MGRRRNSNRRNNGGKGKTNDSRGIVARGVRPINKRGRKEYDTISLKRAEQHLGTIVNSGLFQINADFGGMVVVSGLEARRMGFSTDCFERISARGIEGSGFLPMKLQPGYVVWRIMELINLNAVFTDHNGRLSVGGPNVKIPNEEEKELHWDPRKKGRNGRMGGPRGRCSKMNKLGLNGGKSYTWSQSRNQGHLTCPGDSKGWKSRKEAERNGGVAASTGRRVKTSGHFAHTQRTKAAAAATIRTERKIQQVNAESKESVVDLKGLNKKLQADQEKRAKAEAQKAARVEADTDDLAIDAMFAPAQKKE